MTIATSIPALLFVGSSSVAPGSPMPGFVGAELGLEVEPAGRVGARVVQWRAWLEAGDHPGLAGRRGIIVHLGGNEPLSRPPSAEDVRAVHRALVAGGGGVPVVWLPPPEWPAGNTDAFGNPMRGRRRQMVAALRAAGVPYVRTAPELPASAYRSDGVHPTREGYALWARRVAPELADRLRGGRGGDGSVVPWLVGACFLGFLAVTRW